MKQRSRLTREQLINLRAGQHVLMVEGSYGLWGDIAQVRTPAGGRRVFEIKIHRGNFWVGVEQIAEVRVGQAA